MSMYPALVFDYSDGRTKQAFKDETDINKIIKKAQVEGGISHALKYPEAVYGEFTGVDLLGAYEQVKRAEAIFNDLPSEVRREFGNDALKFAGFASDPRNISRLSELIPAIAEPGRQFPDMTKRDEPRESGSAVADPRAGDQPGPDVSGPEDGSEAVEASSNT